MSDIDDGIYSEYNDCDIGNRCIDIDIDNGGIDDGDHSEREQQQPQ